MGRPGKMRGFFATLGMPTRFFTSEALREMLDDAG
jgi:hypothetical protein